MLKDAHFQTSQKIISFFQFALLIFSAPLALLTSDNISATLLGVIFSLIGLIELVVIAYLSSLRAEALLYARQINRIRSIVYTSGIVGRKKEEIHNNKILLSQDRKPEYFDTNQFLYIVIVLGMFSAFYVSFGVYKFLPHFLSCKNVLYLLISCACAVIMGAFSLLIYLTVCNKNENGSIYFKRRIGVDIDGVLNKHEETFVEICNQLNKTSLKVTDITSLPVHYTEKISLAQEQNVFKTKEYWERQIPEDNVEHYLIQEIKNKYGYKPYIFTLRDWNVCQNISGEKVSYNIKRETKKWLKKIGIKYKKIRFEKGNVDRPVSLFHLKYWTRFHFFVEDNTVNAEKLSHICEYVFLLNHNYNQDDSLPYNVIRVSNWKEIYEWIKKLC